MSIFYVILASIIEGLTEFLPVSSTGHLIILDNLFKQTSPNLVSSFNIFIQAGAILAVIDLYKKELLANFKLIKLLFISFLPTALAGLLLYPTIKHYLLNNLFLVCLSLIVGGFVLLLIKAPKHPQNLDQLKPDNAFVIGTFQVLSMIPGTSRALSAILGGIVSKLNLKDSIKYSFLLAIPTILAATILDLYKSRHLLADQSQYLPHFAFGFILSYLFAKIVITKFLSALSQHKSLRFFGVYRIFLGLFILTLLKLL